MEMILIEEKRSELICLGDLRLSLSLWALELTA